MLEYVALLIMIILGLVLAFFGKRILETIAFIIGALIGAALGLYLAPQTHSYVVQYIESLTIWTIILVVIGSLIGGYLGQSLMYGMISMMVAGICASVAFLITNNALITLIVFFIVLVIMWFLVEKFLAAMTALLGGCLVGFAVWSLTGGLGFISLILFIIVAAGLTIFGARYQLDED